MVTASNDRQIAGKPRFTCHRQPLHVIMFRMLFRSQRRQVLGFPCNVQAFRFFILVEDDHATYPYHPRQPVASAL